MRTTNANMWFYLDGVPYYYFETTSSAREVGAWPEQWRLERVEGRELKCRCFPGQCFRDFYRARITGR